MFAVDIHSFGDLWFIAISEWDTPQSDGFSVPSEILSSLLPLKCKWIAAASLAALDPTQ